MAPILPCSLKSIAIPGFFSEGIAVTGGFLLLLLLAPLDVITGLQMSFHALYLFPLTLIALHSSKNDLVVTAVALSITVQLIVMPASNNHPTCSIFIIAASNSVFALMARYLRTHMLEAKHLSTIDPLTQLFNRRALDQALHAEVRRQRRYGGHFSAALIDLDGFKQLNDSMGHKAGDQALTLMGQILREQTRQSDTIARLGGDEFVIIMPNTQAADCEKICHALCHQVDVRMKEVICFPITASIGYTTVDAVFDYSANVSSDISNDVLTIADRAMYQAKSAGKGRVVRGYIHT